MNESTQKPSETHWEPPPQPEPEHQRRINRGHWFERIAIAVVVFAGIAYLMWSGNEPQVETAAPETVDEATSLILAANYERASSGEVEGQSYLVLRRDLESFTTRIALLGKEPAEPLDTALIWLTLNSGDDPAPGVFQDVVNTVAGLAQTLVPTSNEALETAISTITLETDTLRPHEKGVAQTKDGWKITYVTYREADVNDVALVLVLQRLSVASDPAFALFHRHLFTAIKQGANLEDALRLNE